MSSNCADMVVWGKFYALNRFVLTTIASPCNWLKLWVKNYELTVQVTQNQVLRITAKSYRVTS